MRTIKDLTIKDKLWFITSDEYYVSITKDMYKDIVE